MDRKALSLPILVSIVVGNMIGTGIYLLPASLAQYGTMSLLAWVYTSIGATLLAIVFTHLNKRYPKTGGPYVYCKEAFGKLPGFIVAYIYWMCNIVSIAGIAVASTGYLGFIFPELDSNMPEYNRFYALLIEVGMVWLFTLVNLIGIHTAGVVQVFLTIIKLIPLVLISIVGLFTIHIGNITHFTSGATSNFTAISSAATLTLWAFIGLEAATVPAENTKGSSDVYKATLYGVLGTGAVYIISTFVLMGMIEPSKLAHSQFPFADAGTMLFGPYAALFVTICAVVSGLGALNVCVLLQGQIVFAAARDHMFPKIFAKLSKHDVPVAAQLLSSGIVTLLLMLTIQPSLLKQFDNIALLAALFALLTYFAVTLAELKFILISHRTPKKFLLYKSTPVAILATLYSLWMMSSFTMNVLLVAVGVILLCVPIYYFTIRKYA